MTGHAPRARKEGWGGGWGWRPRDARPAHDCRARGGNSVQRHENARKSSCQHGTSFRVRFRTRTGSGGCAVGVRGRGDQVGWLPRAVGRAGGGGGGPAWCGWLPRARGGRGVGVGEGGLARAAGSGWDWGATKAERRHASARCRAPQRVETSLGLPYVGTEARDTRRVPRFGVEGVGTDWGGWA